MGWTILGGNAVDHILDVTDDVGTRAKFKQPRDQGPRKLIEVSNELIVHQLARTVGLTTAYTCFAQIEGRPGVISVFESSLNWTHIAANHLQNRVLNLDEFRQLVPFDFWVANTDRSTGRQDHVVVKQLGSSYLAYPIDASHTLNGHIGEMWPTGNVDDPSRIPAESYSHVSESEVQGYFHLEPMIFRIQTLSDDAIAGVVDTVTAQVGWNRPLEEIEPLKGNSEIIKKLLSFRRNPLASWMRRWCQAKNKPVPSEEAVTTSVK